MKKVRKNIVVLGSTGSVGRQTLQVVRSLPDRFRVVGLSGHSRCELLSRQVEEFEPEVAVMTDRAGVDTLAEALRGRDVELLVGQEGLVRLAAWEGADVVVCAVSGSAGLAPTIAALESGKTLALANKESVVTCGPLLRNLVARNGGVILPVDSEHSAIFQLLQKVAPEAVERIVLTASGGAFYGRTEDELARVTRDDACKHPIWQMGPKITVDSANLMNKALEVVEARWLFDLPADRIRVLIHPQSVVHCIVELVDGTCLAYMAAPDMRLPIQYALSYPERVHGSTDRLDLAEVGQLEFYEPDGERYPALALGYRVAEAGGTSGAVLSAADEVAVRAFLDGRIGFTEIVPIVAQTLNRHKAREAGTLQDVMAAARWARQEAERCLEEL